MIAGECGSPIKRESCETVISVVDGTGVLLKRGEEKDAIFGLPPHEAIAKNPLYAAHTTTAAVSRGRIVRRCVVLSGLGGTRVVRFSAPALGRRINKPGARLLRVDAVRL